MNFLRVIKISCVVFSLIVALLINNGCTDKNTEGEMLKPPIAKKIKKELTINNHTRIDNYYWLRERENPDVLEYLKIENDYTESVMKHIKDFQGKLFDEMVGRIKQTDLSIPYKYNGYYYYTRYEEKKEYPMTQGLEKTEDKNGAIYSLFPSHIKNIPVDTKDTFYYGYNSNGKTFVFFRDAGT